LEGERGSSNFAGPELNAGATGNGGFGVTNPETPEDEVEDKEERKPESDEEIPESEGRVRRGRCRRSDGRKSLGIVEFPAAGEEHGHQGNAITEGVMDSDYKAVVGHEQMDFPQGLIHAKPIAVYG